MMDTIGLAESPDLARITTPTLMIHSPADHLLSVPAIQAMAARIGATRKQVIPYPDNEDPHQHLLAGDILSPGSTAVVASMIVDFVNNSGE